MSPMRKLKHNRILVHLPQPTLQMLFPKGTSGISSLPKVVSEGVTILRINVTERGHCPDKNNGIIEMQTLILGELI